MVRVTKVFSVNWVTTPPPLPPHLRQGREGAYRLSHSLMANDLVNLAL